MMTAEAMRIEPIGEHPDPQVLGAYHKGRLTPQEEEEIQRHLVACRPCTDFVLELGEFLGGDAAPTLETSQEAAILARQLLRKVEPAKARGPWNVFGWRAAAAALVAVLAGFWGYNLGLSKSAPGGAPMKAEPLTVVELTDSTQRSGTASEKEQTTSQPEGPMAILLTPNFLEPYTRYRVQIKSDDGKDLGQVMLQTDDTGTLYLVIPGDNLLPGRYLFQIHSVIEPREEPTTLALVITPTGDKD
jgi:hypothetical protein